MSTDQSNSTPKPSERERKEIDSPRPEAGHEISVPSPNKDIRQVDPEKESKAGVTPLPECPSSDPYDEEIPPTILVEQLKPMEVLVSSDRSDPKAEKHTENHRDLPATGVDPLLNAQKEDDPAKTEQLPLTERETSKKTELPKQPSSTDVPVTAKETPMKSEADLLKKVSYKEKSREENLQIRGKPPGQSPPTHPSAEWKVLEPTDRSDPVPHEMCEHVSRSDAWSLTAASVRGKLHAHKALWRDDAFAFEWTDDWTIVAVSDGAGSAKISRIGARLACTESVRAMKGLLTGYRLLENDGKTPSEADLLRLRTFLAEGARKAQIAILREAQNRKCAPKDMSATLLLVIHAAWKKSSLVGVIQVGDGAVGIYDEDDACTLIGTADHGEYSSETRFLTTPHIEYEFDNRVRFALKKGIRCIGVMSDGVSDDFFPEEKRLAELFNGNPVGDLKTGNGLALKGVMHEVTRNHRDGKALQEWLRYEKKGSSDDRTLVLMYRSDK